jgi:hypothetical protein
MAIGQHRGQGRSLDPTGYEERPACRHRIDKYFDRVSHLLEPGADLVLQVCEQMGPAFGYLALGADRDPTGQVVYVRATIEMGLRARDRSRAAHLPPRCVFSPPPMPYYDPERRRAKAAR